MSKCVVSINNTDLVLDTDKGLQVMQLLADSERYETSWRSREDGGTTKHVYPIDEGFVSVQLMSEVNYKMYRLAGKPENR